MAASVWRHREALAERFGADEIDQLRESLWAVASQLDIERPDCLPILG